MKRLLTLLAIALLSCGCPDSTKPTARHAKPFPGSAALLPFNNHSNSLVGPVLIRKLLEDMLSGSSLELQDPAETDESLRALAITDGGQLGSVTPQKLGEKLGVEALFYGELVDFSYTNVGVLSKRSVKARLKLVDAKTGETLWAAEKERVNSKAGLSADAIKENFAMGLGTKFLEKAMNSPLKPETEDVAHDLLDDLVRAKQNW